MVAHAGSPWSTATVQREPAPARPFFDRFQPIHGVTYFAPEARAARHAPLGGRPLFAANRALPWPDDPLTEGDCSPATGRGPRWPRTEGPIRIEHRRPCAVRLDALSGDEVGTLLQALTLITQAVGAGGDLPAATQMSVRRDELHGISGRLTSTGECQPGRSTERPR